MIKNNIYIKMENRLNEMTIEELKLFLRSYSSRLCNASHHCRDLVDLATNIPYITSIEGSGLSVINNTGRNMSEDTYLKSKSILGYAQNNPNSSYTEDELLFTLGYISLYYKIKDLNQQIKNCSIMKKQ